MYVSSTLVCLALALSTSVAAFEKPTHGHVRRHHAKAAKRQDQIVGAAEPQRLRRRTCSPKKSSASASASSTAAPSISTANLAVAAKTSTLSSSASSTSSSSVKAEATSSKAAPATSSTPKTTSTPKASATATPVKAAAVDDNSGDKPSDWPTATQAGASPTSTVATDADPYLKELSKAYNNKNNAAYTKEHVGEMTYYSTGLVSCGDVYTDETFTAAVSHKMYDSWPGADASKTNSNPICGPFVTGRKAITNAGTFATAFAGTSPKAAFATIGGDGLINCDSSIVGLSGSQCHVPMTATVWHGDKSIKVKIVDRCEGCAEDDIDLTPAAFAAIADMGLGRTTVKWSFDQY